MHKLIHVCSFIAVSGLLFLACGEGAPAPGPEKPPAPAVAASPGKAAPAETAPAAAPAATSGKAPKSFDAPPPVGTKATCPVMENEFIVKEDSERSEHEGKHVAFCCGGCKPQFDKDPKKYL